MNSFLEGRPVVSRAGLPALGQGSRLPDFGNPRSVAEVGNIPRNVSPSSDGHGEKKIETVTVDGVVQKIVITCTCGEEIEVFCGY